MKRAIWQYHFRCSGPALAGPSFFQNPTNLLLFQPTLPIEILLCYFARPFLSMYEVWLVIAGFDYGSSNCAVGVMQNNNVSLVPLFNDHRLVPSTLYAYHSGLVVGEVLRHISHEQIKSEYVEQRQVPLNQLPRLRSELDITAEDTCIFIGEEAINQYLDCPEEGYFVKSPKSFFGAQGLKQEQLNFFEDIATVMMIKIKSSAEAQLGDSLTQTVIGRPVNFQSTGGEIANQQAIAILTRAAQRAGFKEVEFLFEPLAAGIDFETGLTTNKKVLVVDIGGGTTDCSMVQMGPAHLDKADRQQDFLAHTGKRVGGNDLDIHLAYHAFMPLFGLGGQMKNGLPIPNQSFWNAIKINDVVLQAEFYSAANLRFLNELHKEVEHTQTFARLLHLQQNRLGHQLVRHAELAKIALSSRDNQTIDLGFIEAELNAHASEPTLEKAILDPVQQIKSLISEAVNQAQCPPDLVYVTGGSAQSPILRAAIKAQLGEVEILNGDHFGSVTAGLTKWAHKIFR